MQNRTGTIGQSVADKAGELVHTYKKQLGMAGAAAGGYVMASSYIFGGVSPFGVAFCATMPAPYTVFAALGAILGYVFSAAALTNMKYLAAVVLVLTLRWLLTGRIGSRFATALAAVVTFAALAIANVAVLLTMDATLYDSMLSLAEVFLGGGAAYFFARSLSAVEVGWSGVNRSDVSCLIVSFGIVIMGFSSIHLGNLSVGRMLSVLIVLLCARIGGEAGGSVAGIAAGITMGLCGGDYAYAISAYGFGGLLAGVFSNLGRIATAGSFIVINTIAALMTQSTGQVYISLTEIFVASVLFMIIPQSSIAKLRSVRIGRWTDDDTTAQAALRGRLGEISAALLDISSTTREVSQRLGKLEGDNPAAIYNRVSDRVCIHCGSKTSCWQFHYTETMNAMNDAFAILRREGTINRQRMPQYFVKTCCQLEDFVTELNTQFRDQVAKQGTQRKVSKVRSVVTDQFEGLAMMLDEISGELCEVTLLEPVKSRKIREYFEREGFTVQQVRAHSNEYQRVTVEVTFPEYQVAKLKKAEAALDLCTLLEAEFDLPYIALHQKNATVVFTEKASFSVEVGAYQIAPESYKLCGDAYETIPNRGGKAHFILSDGMGSGGGAAVDSHMATGLLSRLISVGFSHEAALKMVNSVLLIKSGEESLATIDICTLDLYTGRVDFYKAGAAPTYVIRGGRAGYISSTSLPAGILQGVDFDKSGATLREADIVVMVSDGVVATGADWVKSELEANKDADMQRLAEKLAMTAKVRRTDGREDDITVVAVALRRGA